MDSIANVPQSEHRDDPDANQNRRATLSAVRAVTQEDSTSPLNPADSMGRPGIAPRIRRRNRLITSCLECRRRKLKCDKLAPCTNCTRFQRPCLYLSPAKDAHSQQKLADLKDRMGAIEKDLEHTVARKDTISKLSNKHNPRAQNATEGTDESEDVSDDEVLEPTPLAAADLVYEDTVDDELMDLGVQLGKMRISERIGGWSRPKLVDELNETLKDINLGKSRFSISPQTIDHRDLRQPNISRLQASPKSYIGPGPDYIAPSSNFFFPGMSAQSKLTDYLPGKDAADLLISQYWTAVHYMCRIVHRPTFEVQYALFWAQLNVGNQPVAPVQALIFAAMFSAAVSMSNEEVAQHFGTSRVSLVDSLRVGTELALAKANFLRTTKVDTLQAFIMYLIPQARAELSKAHSALIAAAVRLGECIGLHRDGSNYNMTPLETHVRRMLWHQLCFLDMRSCEASGPRPQIRKDDYDTKMPLNVDDTDFLDQKNPPTTDKSTWTDMTFSRIRAECTEMRRKTWFDVQLIDARKKSLSSVLIKVQRFVTAFEAKFLPMIDITIPFQNLASLICRLFMSSMHVQVLHRYLFSTAQRMPDRLRQVLIESVLGQLESTTAYDSLPEVKTWAWYRGAFFQYHSALLIMIEVYAFPMRKEAARIWKCLDYIFEVPSHLAPKQKAELIITDLRDRMEVYHQMRKLRASKQMEETLGEVVHRPQSWFKRAGIGAKAFFDSQQVEPQLQQTPETTMPVSGLDFSPPSMQTDSDISDSRHGSVGASGGQDQMPTMDDIDWVEWDKVFNPEVNTGELNIPDFDMADFTGNYGGSAMAPAAYDEAAMTSLGGVGALSGFNLPTAAELADVHFSPTLIPDNYKDFSYQS